MEKLIITIAPNGSLPTKEMNPNVPITPDEMIVDIKRCYDAGASICHIHARDKNQKTCHDPEYFKAVVSGVKACSNMITQISTGGRASFDPTSRLQGLQADPEMASLSVGSCNFADHVYENSPEHIMMYAKAMKEKGIKPEFEMFDLSMAYWGKKILEAGYSFGTPWFNIILGVKGALEFSPRNLLAMVDSLPPGAKWNSIGIGAAQLKMATHAIMWGGHVRVGLEDNIYYTKGVHASNVQLVERVVRLAKELGREIASPDEARQILGLPLLNK
ncbi:MAG: 3-keto-5-aminohexanoate cleavage protein [Clostridia bacterium]|nr:3-keto-5-aminohexanoate cleavage protein [Clostridia bacterium]